MPPSGGAATQDAAERELVAAVAAALATASLPRAGVQPVARPRTAAWRLAGRRRALQQWIKRA